LLDAPLLFIAALRLVAMETDRLFFTLDRWAEPAASESTSGRQLRKFDAMFSLACF